MVTLFAVNPGLQDMSRELDLSPFGQGPRHLEVWTLADTRATGEPDATNSFAEPDRIVPRKSKLLVEGGRFRYRFPALSLTVLRWQTR